MASSSSTLEGTWSCPFKGFHCCPSGVCGNKGISRMISHLKSVHLSTDERKNVLREAITTDYNLFREVEGTLKVFGQWMCGKCMRLHALSRACHHPDGLVRFSEGMGDGGGNIVGILMPPTNEPPVKVNGGLLLDVEPSRRVLKHLSYSAKASSIIVDYAL
ncbi:reverse transcriptase domain-containing protein [Artemisia annua]|uniref:Reverse transcriptase domain-containing protein n=1 Tax=Artemisia annua TaxID=35608 RepID=A0A2U1PBY1_ARTAN|nr:reverse transcriptase domain-containing protein [Artemisia annua]